MPQQRFNGMTDATMNPEPATEAAEHPLCSMCNRPAPMQCQACKCSRYCSTACQKQDWSTHKLVCKKFKDFDASNRPAPNKIRAIYFPYDEPTPRFVWVGFKPSFPSERIGVFDRDDLPPAARAFTNVPCIIGYLEKNAVLDRSYDGPIGSWSPGLCRPEMPGNMSMAKLDEVLPQVAYGPALFFGQGRDLDTMDFRHMVDHCRNSYWEAATNEEYGKVVGPDTVEAVRVNCLGDIEICERPLVESFRMPLTACDVSAETKLPVGDVIGIPLVVGHMADNPAWRDRYTPDDGLLCVINKGVATLYPPELERKTGSVAIVRKDRKPLLKQHMVALMRYCAHLSDQYLAKVAPATAQSAAKEGHLALRRFGEEKADFIHEHASKEDFANFYKEWLGTELGRDFRDQPGPYEV